MLRSLIFRVTYRSLPERMIPVSAGIAENAVPVVVPVGSDIDLFAGAVAGSSVKILVCTDILIVADVDFRMRDFIQENVAALKVCRTADLAPRDPRPAAVFQNICTHRSGVHVVRDIEARLNQAISDKRRAVVIRTEPLIPVAVVAVGIIICNCDAGRDHLLDLIQNNIAAVVSGLLIAAEPELLASAVFRCTSADRFHDQKTVFQCLSGHGINIDIRCGFTKHRALLCSELIAVALRIN